jgi:hypothetical protein
MKKILFFLAVSVGLLFTSCDDHDDHDHDHGHDHEHELITTVRLNITPVDGGNTVIWNWADTDGDGGNPPMITTEPLDANTVYNIDVAFLNESGTEMEDITPEVKLEDEDHQVFFILSDNLTYTYGDSDSEGNPLGLTGTLTTVNSGEGTMRLVLLHEPMKNNEGVSEGDMSQAQGETDIDVSFTFNIQ